MMTKKLWRVLLICWMVVVVAIACREGDAPANKEAPRAQVTPLVRPTLTPLFDDLERRTFNYFWETADPETGLIPDRYPYTEPFASIAAVGFGLTAYGIGVERGYVTRDQAIERTLVTLRFFEGAPQGSRAEGMAGYHGFYYHFLDLKSGGRYADWVEASSVDTALLLGGVLFAQSYFDQDTPQEKEIRHLADTIYRRVDWTWMQARPPLISMGWVPKQGFIAYDWQGYNEGMLLYVLALGAPTQSIGKDAWKAWTQTYQRAWGTFQQQEYLGFGPALGHQYSHVWIDFRGIQDTYMRDRGLDYFENSRRATYAQRAYAMANPMGWKLYGENIWGLTASDGPAGTEQPYGGGQRTFRRYSARGAGIADAFDDGTIAPTAAAASLPFAPEIVVPAVEEMHKQFGDVIYSTYGFLDSFNPSFTYDVPVETGHLIPGFGWVASAYIGIDQGPIIAMIENYRDDFVWKTMRKNPYIRRGLQRAGFTGGWLEPTESGSTSTAASSQ